MELDPLFTYGLPFLTAFAVGLLGRTRRIGFWGGVFFSILLTPLGGFLVALVSGAKRIEEEPAPKPLPAGSSEKKRRWLRR
jgi:hypothetical protein